MVLGLVMVGILVFEIRLLLWFFSSGVSKVGRVVEGVLMLSLLIWIFWMGLVSVVLLFRSLRKVCVVLVFLVMK